MLERIQEHWSEILEHVKDEHEIGDISFNTFIKPLNAYRFENDVVYIGGELPSSAVDYLTKKYALPLKVAIGEITGIHCDVFFALSDDEEALYQERRFHEMSKRAGLSPKYTFDTFVVGNNNRFAHAAALAVAESPGEIYNPLFIYGGVGLGKTHLMQSIAHFIIQENQEVTVRYVTSEDFTNEVIEVVRGGDQKSLSLFREKYRNLDVLLIDDVQFIIGKESTQEEFFHTFNALHAARKQIILSSDRPPKEFDILEERIKSRFEWGLMADIQIPDFETRMAILRKKQEQEGYELGNDILKYIAENIKYNIRELEGSLNKIIAKARIENREPSVEMAKETLSDIISPDAPRVVTPMFVLETVADHFDLTLDEICGVNRSKKFSYPRQIAMYLIRSLTPSNYEDIGNMLGGKNHTTVMHGTNKIENNLEIDEELRATIDILKKKINPG